MFNFLWNNLWGQMLMTLLISMVPIIELRGAIPIAVGAGLPFYIAIPIAVIGNLLPVPFIIMFIKRIFAWIRRQLPKLNSMVDKLEARAQGKSETVQKS
ncbi:MAG: small multi-drug export protein, partial [Clostridia bacterium]|nr:small multi-drug export protein [Clostridia bacterium]